MLTRKIKVDMIVNAINIYFGFRPEVKEYEDHTMISFTPSQRLQLQQWIEGQLSAAPGEIRFNILPVVLPLILKKSLPWLAGAAGTGFIVGKVV